MISLVLCTRNRGRQLQGTLASIAQQNYSAAWEVVIVDNGSTDDTASVVTAFANSPDLCMTVSIAQEPCAGLARARNRGIDTARGDIIAFTDDDCYIQSDFVTAVDVCFRDPRIAFCGGRVMLHDPTDMRVTIQELNERVELPPGKFIPSGFIHGANMAFRREHLIAARGFDERLGAGTYFKSGEDTDLIRRLSAAGHEGIYDPCMVVHHHHGRRTTEAVDALLAGYCRGRGAVMIKLCLDSNTRRICLKPWYWQLKGLRPKLAAREIFAAVQFLVRYGPTRDQLWDHPNSTMNPP